MLAGVIFLWICTVGHKGVSLCWLMVWRYILAKKLDEKTNYITN
jgi:hypothetical protein